MFLQMDSTEWGIRVVYALVFFRVFEHDPNLKLVVTEVPGVISDQMLVEDGFHLLLARRRKPTGCITLRASTWPATSGWAIAISCASRLRPQ